MQADWQNEAKASVAKVNYLCSQESSWKCRLHVWTCEHERREGAKSPQKPGLGWCQRQQLQWELEEMEH